MSKILTGIKLRKKFSYQSIQTVLLNQVLLVTLVQEVNSFAKSSIENKRYSMKNLLFGIVIPQFSVQEHNLFSEYSWWFILKNIFNITKFWLKKLITTFCLKVLIFTQNLCSSETSAILFSISVSSRRFSFPLTFGREQHYVKTYYSEVACSWKNYILCEISIRHSVKKW